jgi:hypothetical protein
MLLALFPMSLVVRATKWPPGSADGHSQFRKDQAAFFCGTLAPLRRASESPMAMACLRLFTFRPLPDFSLPRLSLCISFSTFCCALGLYLRPLERERLRDELLRCERAEVRGRFEREERDREDREEERERELRER